MNIEHFIDTLERSDKNRNGGENFKEEEEFYLNESNVIIKYNRYHGISANDTILTRSLPRLFLYI